MVHFSDFFVNDLKKTLVLPQYHVQKHGNVMFVQCMLSHVKERPSLFSTVLSCIVFPARHATLFLKWHHQPQWVVQDFLIVINFQPELLLQGSTLWLSLGLAYKIRQSPQASVDLACSRKSQRAGLRSRNLLASCGSLEQEANELDCVTRWTAKHCGKRI